MSAGSRASVAGSHSSIKGRLSVLQSVARPRSNSTSGRNATQMRSQSQRTISRGSEQTPNGDSRASGRKLTRGSTKYKDDQDMSNPPASSGRTGVLVQSTIFQAAMGVAIIMNAAVIGFETDDPEYPGWKWVELLFLIVFSAEFVLRLYVFSLFVYFHPNNPDIAWNVFDAGIVFGGVFGTVAEHLRLVSHKASGVSTLLRVIRLLRIFRIFRIVRFLKQLYMLVFGFGIAAVATVWVTILAVVMLYVCAILAIKLRMSVPTDDQYYAMLHERFDKVGGTMFTLFELMLNPDLAPYEDLFGKHHLWTLFIISFVSFGSFGMLALLTGVISEAMFEKNTMRLEEERSQREDKRQVLKEVSSNLFDELANVDGRSSQTGGRHSISRSAHRKEIPIDELLASIGTVTEKFQQQGFHFTIYDISEVLKCMDVDDSGTVSKTEFLHAMTSISEGVQAATVLELHQVVQTSGCKVEKDMAAIIDSFNNSGRQLDSKLTSASNRCKLLAHNIDKLGELMSGREREMAARERERKLAMNQSHSISPEASLESSRIAMKIDAFEASLRQMHYSVNGLLKRAHSALPRHSVERNGDPWSMMEFEAPLDEGQGTLEIPSITADVVLPDLLIPTPRSTTPPYLNPSDLNWG